MSAFLLYKVVLSFLVTFYSGLPGLWLAEKMFKRGSAYFYLLKEFTLTQNVYLYRFLAVDVFVYCLKNSFFRHFNTKIRITKAPGLDEIDELLDQIAVSELCHLFGLMFVLIFQIIAVVASGSFDLVIYSSFFNLIFNVYPILLQERNKLRLKNFSLRIAANARS